MLIRGSIIKPSFSKMQYAKMASSSLFLKYDNASTLKFQSDFVLKAEWTINHLYLSCDTNKRINDYVNGRQNVHPTRKLPLVIGLF
jgi:hypothetical protein